jgi:hypothetical protein
MMGYRIVGKLGEKKCTLCGKRPVYCKCVCTWCGAPKWRMVDGDWEHHGSCKGATRA